MQCTCGKVCGTVCYIRYIHTTSYVHIGTRCGYTCKFAYVQSVPTGTSSTVCQVWMQAWIYCAVLCIHVATSMGTYFDRYCNQEAERDRERGQLHKYFTLPTSHIIIHKYVRFLDRKTRMLTIPGLRLDSLAQLHSHLHWTASLMLY